MHWRTEPDNSEDAGSLFEQYLHSSFFI